MGINRLRKVKNKRLTNLELIITLLENLRFRVIALKHPKSIFINLDGLISQRKGNFWKNRIV